MSEKLEIDSEKVKDPKTINTKVTLVIKQGPLNAEIINGGERESNNGVIDFTGVQLTEPGDYVIEAIPDSLDLSSTTFNIKVDPEPEVIEQESEGVEEEEVQGDRPIVAQILQPTIKLPPMKFDATESQEDNKEIGFGLGFTPFFWYNGVSISERDIKSLIIYYDDFLPKAQVILKDTTGLLENDETKPTNDTKFEIFINSGSDVLKSIHMRFKLEIDKKNPNGSHTLVGTLDIPEFYRIGYNSYKGTTFNVLKNICQETGLGYNSNIKDTEDSMSWKRNGVLLSEFIRGLIKRSYISDDSFMMGYIDYYYCFNYVDIEKEWNRDISGDVGISSQGVSQLDKTSTEDDKIVQLALTNDSSANSSSFYFEDYKVKNNSTYQSTKRGMSTISKVYDRVKKQFLVFKIDAKNEGDDKLILKGAKMDEEEQAANFRNNYSGKLDTSNMHTNYHYALDQNKRNLQNLVNMEVDMTLPQPNFNIYKFQKVQVNFVNPKPTVTDSNLTYDRLSGGWIVIDIKYVWLSGKLKQKLTLARKDMGKTKEEIENEVTAVDDSLNKEINENEESNPVPNSRFTEGEVYLMEDESGRRFEVSIINILSNGQDFAVNIKEIVVVESQDATKNNQLPNEITPTTDSINVSNEIILSDIILNIDVNSKISNDELGTLKIIEKIQESTSGFDFGDELDLSLLDDEFTESQFEGNEESFNEITDEPPGPNPDEGKEFSPVNPDSKLFSKVNSRYYIVDSSNGLAGKRLRNIMTGLELFLSKKYPGVKIGFNGIMRDLVSSTYPNSSARAVASLHGAGLAIDVTFKIPGKVWDGIGDNKNLASDQELSRLIYDYVKSQGDITWGGEWGTKDGTKAESGIIKGWGITEYHHFEIKAGKILDYWKPFKDEIVDLGINFDKLNKVGRGSELERLNKILLNSVNITA